MSFPTVSQLSGLGESSGAVAQLGERLLCKQEVVGSIPSASTIIDAWPGHAHRASRRLRGVDRSLTSFIGRGLKV